jgi:hypothetical protein
MPGIYIINPAPDVPSYHTAEGYGRMDGRGWVQVADLTIATIAALVPPGWDIRITDEAITGVDFDADVDFVAITGKISLFIGQHNERARNRNGEPALTAISAIPHSAFHGITLRSIS